MTDVINLLAGIEAGSALDKARDNRPEARKHAQASYEALFAPKTPGTFSLQERFAVAAFVAGLHGKAETKEYYVEKLTGTGASPELLVAVASEVFESHTHGPYGHYPTGPLTIENSDGLKYAVTVTARHVLGQRLATAFEHAHMLVFHPRDAAPPSLQAMLDAGWSTTDVVTLSQLVSFLAFQIRVVAGLKVLNARSA
ncbi:CMD domain protein, Avi_7170 family [Enhydrobacter aerosaccus]|uniref:CMD domain protein, Avi_7170 family n=1 Tax=Enhydrobacter aerosaccus TaxID=225324 RepID=A0A1T4R6Z6_9HYPH|nr:CMD domain protein [Enhydrobacter aerosaccus]SKA11715.1 CMD domain protein, Avi_7170 family [Enhydrobacter aerosaccus]